MVIRQALEEVTLLAQVRRRRDGRRRRHRLAGRRHPPRHHARADEDRQRAAPEAEGGRLRHARPAQEGAQEVRPEGRSRSLPVQQALVARGSAPRRTRRSAARRATCDARRGVATRAYARGAARAGEPFVIVRRFAGVAGLERPSRSCAAAASPRSDRAVALAGHAVTRRPARSGLPAPRRWPRACPAAARPKFTLACASRDPARQAAGRARAAGRRAVHAVRVRRVRGQPARPRRRARPPARGDRRVGGARRSATQVPHRAVARRRARARCTSRRSRGSQALAQATQAQLFLFDHDRRARGDTREADRDRHAEPPRRARSQRARARVRPASRPRASRSRATTAHWYKTGYAPVRAPRRDASCSRSAPQAPASYFERLADLRTRLFAWGAGLAARQRARRRDRDAPHHAQRAPARRRGRADRRRRPARAGQGRPRATSSACSRQTMERMRVQLAERDAQDAADARRHRARGPQPARRHDAVRRASCATSCPTATSGAATSIEIERELGYLERVVNDFLEYARRPKPELADVAAAPTCSPRSRSSRRRPRHRGRGRARAAADRARRPRPAPPRAAQPRAQRGAGRDRRRSRGQRRGAAVRARARGDELALSVWNRGKEIPPETSRQAVRAVLHDAREGHRPRPRVRARHRRRPRRPRSRSRAPTARPTFSIVIPPVASVIRRTRWRRS